MLGLLSLLPLFAPNPTAATPNARFLLHPGRDVIYLRLGQRVGRHFPASRPLVALLLLLLLPLRLLMALATTPPVAPPSEGGWLRGRGGGGGWCFIDDGTDVGGTLPPPKRRRCCRNAVVPVAGSQKEGSSCCRCGSCRLQVAPNVAPLMPHTLWLFSRLVHCLYAEMDKEEQWRVAGCNVAAIRLSVAFFPH